MTTVSLTFRQSYSFLLFKILLLCFMGYYFEIHGFLFYFIFCSVQYFFSNRLKLRELVKIHPAGICGWIGDLSGMSEPRMNSDMTYIRNQS